MSIYIYLVVKQLDCIYTLADPGVVLLFFVTFGLSGNAAKDESGYQVADT